MIPGYTLRLEDYGDHIQVYKKVPTIKIIRGVAYFPVGAMDTDIKLGNIYRRDGDLFEAQRFSNSKKVFSKLDNAVAFLLQSEE